MKNSEHDISVIETGEVVLEEIKMWNDNSKVDTDHPPSPPTKKRTDNNHENSLCL